MQWVQWALGLVGGDATVCVRQWAWERRYDGGEYTRVAYAPLELMDPPLDMMSTPLESA